MTKLDKKVPFRIRKVRPPRLKPEWHDFYCIDCGLAVREFSDPRASLYLCNACIDRRVGRKPENTTRSPQVVSAGDWWSLWAMEYESKRAAGLIDASGREV